MINYNNKLFRPISNTENGETTSETVFIYIQNKLILYLNIIVYLKTKKLIARNICDFL